MPTSVAPRIETNASFGAHFSRTNAMAIPKDEASKAGLGEPEAVRRPKIAGAHPLRDKENNIREAIYRAALAPDNAAVSTTKVMICAAAGIPAWRNTLTNGLSTTPARFHGITPTR